MEEGKKRRVGRPENERQMKEGEGQEEKEDEECHSVLFCINR